MTHYVQNCKHGKTLGQCRCPGPNKAVRIVPCPPSCETDLPTKEERDDAVKQALQSAADVLGAPVADLVSAFRGIAEATERNAEAIRTVSEAMEANGQHFTGPAAQRSPYDIGTKR